MSNIQFAASIDSPWTKIEPIRLGPVPSGFGTPCRFLIVTTDEGRRFRFDIFASCENFTFEEARIWAGNVAIGFGSRFHLVNMSSLTVSSLEFGGYFGHLYPSDKYILVASDDRLFRVQPDGSIAWKTDHLGIDGVIVNRIENDVIEGEGEWDPPDGWEPFRVRVDSGKKLD